MRNCRAWMGWKRENETIQKFSEMELRNLILNEIADADGAGMLLCRVDTMKTNLRTMYGRGELSTIPYLRLAHLLDRAKDKRMEEFLS